MAIRFLVVDDATFIRDMVKKQLRERIPGCEVYEATDGKKGIAQLKKQRVDVILSDWEMPGLSGEEFLRWIRGQEAFKETPFIMVTSRGDREHVVAAIKSGVSDFITKPFTSDELLKKTAKQLKKIGKAPKTSLSSASSGKDVAFASVDVLTGGAGKAKPKPKAAAKSAVAADFSALVNPGNAKATSKPAGGKAAASRKPAKSAKTQARIRFANLDCNYVVRGVSLQEISGLVPRPDVLPSLFEQAVVDIELDDGQVARVNGYLSAIEAGENHVDTQIIKMKIRFVDNDPEKFEALSKFVAKVR